MKYGLTLHYSMHEGWLTPWIEGLQRGEAVASTCTSCDLSQFPPIRCCPKCRQPSDGWRTLPGTAQIFHRTRGRDGDFALAQFDGAASQTIVRAEGLPRGCRHATLAPVGDGPPSIKLQPQEPSI